LCRSAWDVEAVRGFWLPIKGLNMRKNNAFRLLKRIHTGGPLSRADLSEMTGLAPSQVSLIVREALNKGLLLERGLAPSKGGRRRVLLEIKPELASLVGIDIGRSHIRFAVTDFGGKMLHYKWLPTDHGKGRDHVLRTVRAELDSLLQKFSTISAIGISHSGVIDHQAGRVLFWPTVEGWNDVPLGQIFADAYGLPTFVEDCVRAMAINERRFGHAQGLHNFVLVSVGMGIGSAIFSNGRLHFGRDGLAGELGHTTVTENGDLCSCGNRGCLEVCSSATAILARVRAELEHGVSSCLTGEVGGDFSRISVELIVEAAKNHDRLAERVVSEAGMHLGTALATVVNLLNPEKVILAGMIPQVGKDTLLGPLLYSLRQRAFPQGVKDLPVVISEFGEEAAALGMVLIAAENLLESRCRNLEAA
jgi:predicted NBD/HSP70 family sugar kinase